jgi:hypothetical protein
MDRLSGLSRSRLSMAVERRTGATPKPGPPARHARSLARRDDRSQNRATAHDIVDRSRRARRHVASAPRGLPWRLVRPSARPPEEACPVPCRRVLRGGSWNNNPRNLRSAKRNRNNADNRNNNIGFRVASTPSCRSRRVDGRDGRAEVRPGRVMMSRLRPVPQPGAASVLGFGRRTPPFPQRRHRQRMKR